MQIFNHDQNFWLLVAIAAAIKVVSSKFQSISRSLTMFATSMLFAVVFADPVVDRLGLEHDQYSVAVGVIIALTADGILRVILSYGRYPASFLDRLREKRTKK